MDYVKLGGAGVKVSRLCLGIVVHNMLSASSSIEHGLCGGESFTHDHKECFFNI